MDDDAIRSSPDSPCSAAKPYGSLCVEQQLTELLAQTNQLLQILIDTLQRDGKAGATVAKPLTVSGNWLDCWTQIVNTAFEASMPNEVCRALLLALEQHKQPLEIIHFNDTVAYEQDHSYALFSHSDTGNCFLVRDPDAPESRFAVFPYPGSATWFLMGKASVKNLYQVLGAEGSYAPHIRIIRPATLQLTGEVNATGHPVFSPLEKGELIAQ